MRLLPESANMFSSAPRTIVLTTKMPPNPTINMASRNFPAYASPEEDSGSDGGGPRKRRRLTHLTPDEKLMRRKLKNRVAAQTARDRKKAQMDELQVKVSELMEENERLQQENAAMRLQMEQAMRRTWELEERLGQANTLPSAVKLETESVGSAASAVPLQKEQTPSPMRQLMNLWVLAMILSMLPFLTSCNSSSPKLRRRKQTKPLRRTPSPSPAPVAPEEWWGPQQRSWNPSMN